MRIILAVLAVMVLASCSTARQGAAHRTQAPRAAALQRAQLAWLVSPGGQAQVTLEEDTDALAGDLLIENSVPTAAWHRAFESQARTVMSQARSILADPALQPAHGHQAYIRLMRDWIAVGWLLQPGHDYGTRAQDMRAWDEVLRASDIIVW
jgi:hypothetical protein